MVDEEEHFNYDFDKDSRVNESSQGAAELHQLHAEVHEEVEEKQAAEDSEEPDPSIDLENLELRTMKSPRSVQPHHSLKKIATAAEDQNDKEEKIELMKKAVGNFITNMLENQ